MNALNQSLDIICAQEAQYLTGIKLEKGYATNSEGNNIRIWTKSRHTCIKNTRYIQIIITKYDNRNLIVCNIHLDCSVKKREKQTKEIIADIKHIRSCAKYGMSNIIACGDFNFDIQDDIFDGLVKVGPPTKTWRKNPAKDWSSSLDHVFVAARIPSEVEWGATESDHKAAIISLKGLIMDRGEACKVISSRLSKTRTQKLKPFSWKSYPRIPIFDRLSGKRIMWSIKEESKIKQQRVASREAILKSELGTSKE